ncbi:hypothetical protein SAMN05421504_11292 [Amycolatopsis xylanica]|uniref:Secreted protein n=1 Tax=Amycolatopsis xylanica TaxID=589385 RepID=A0A1H3RYG8_9PSEU|nr:hypothetical protein [Amycolatopsis xylanica]SDZ30627.1 hypothetical protein SAMN05421504_11292 [Amycolatopsis xylanica]
MRRFLVALATTVALLAPAGAVAASTTGTEARYSVTVSCQLVRIADNNVVGVIYGSGTGTTYNSAFKNAVKDANNAVPSGHYKRHCH